jgi:hypothetical protein
MKKAILLTLFIITFSCSPSGKLTITNLNDLSAFSDNSYMYSLPITRVVVDITTVRRLTIPGPYNAYAQKYLGFEAVPSISKVDWDIVDVRLKTIEEPDPEYGYSVSSGQQTKVLDQIQQLTKEGLIMSPYALISFSQFYPLLVDNPEPIHFTDLSVKRNIDNSHKAKDKKDADDINDNNTGRQRSDLKTLEQKAEEAANFIYKLRKRRFKLLAGMDNTSADSIGIATSVSELDKLEQEYLELFIGKTYTDTLKKTFLYNPQISQDLERNVLCRFSDETGFQDAMGASGIPMVLELKNMHTSGAIENLRMPSTGPTFTNILFYRIPDKAMVRIFYGSNTILEGEVKIFQYGPLVPASIPWN